MSWGGYLQGAAICGQKAPNRALDVVLGRFLEAGREAVGEIVGALSKSDEDKIRRDAAARADFASSPAELLKLERPLTAEEQAKVDAYQGAQADAAQRHEEATPRVDPTTGAKTYAKATYEEGSPTKSTAIVKVKEAAAKASARVHDAPAWQVLFGAMGAVGLGYGLYRLGGGGGEDSR